MTAQPVEITPKPKTGQLVFKPARRGKPPLHLADFDMAGRKQFLKDAGYPAFRASQLSKHYFERFEADPAAMTDLPAAQRDELAAKALPPLLTTVRQLRADQGMTVKSVHRLFDGAMVESVLMRYDKPVSYTHLTLPTKRIV